MTNKNLESEIRMLAKNKESVLEFNYFLNIISNTNLTDFNGLTVTNVTANDNEMIIGLKNQYNMFYLLSIDKDSNNFHMYSSDKEDNYFSFKFETNLSEINCNIIFEYHKDIISISATKKKNKEQENLYFIKYYQGIASMIKSGFKTLSDFRPKSTCNLYEDENMSITFAAALEIAKEMKNGIRKESYLDAKKTYYKK